MSSSRAHTSFFFFTNQRTSPELSSANLPNRNLFLPIMVKVMQRWHRLLGLKVQSSSWYKARLREELAERREARTFLHRLSETADVFYTLGRAQCDGHPLRQFPTFHLYKHPPIYGYMLLKFTSRWAFFRTAAFLSGSTAYRHINEVVNPARDFKIREVASRHPVELNKFEFACHRLRHFWPLLP